MKSLRRTVGALIGVSLLGLTAGCLPLLPVSDDGGYSDNQGGGGGGGGGGALDSQVVGEWAGGSAGADWVDSSGNSEFTSGNGFSLVINADGTYTEETLMNGDPYGLGIFLRDAGVVSTDGNTITFEATERGGLVRQPGEYNWEDGETSADPQVKSYSWRLQATEYGYDLCLTELWDGGGTETCYWPK